MKHHDEWWAFKDEVWKRLEMGEAHYGETTFRKDPVAITREIDEEILDVAAYAFMLWCRVKGLRGRLAQEPVFAPLHLREAVSSACESDCRHIEETYGVKDAELQKLKRDLG